MQQSLAFSEWKKKSLANKMYISRDFTLFYAARHGFIRNE